MLVVKHKVLDERAEVGRGCKGHHGRPLLDLMWKGASDRLGWEFARTRVCVSGVISMEAEKSCEALLCFKLFSCDNGIIFSIS